MIINLSNCDPSTGFSMCIEPQESRRKKANWIIWISPDGSGQLYIGRAETGAVLNDPIMLPANTKRNKG